LTEMSAQGIRAFNQTSYRGASLSPHLPLETIRANES
jgi:hypothetical protein